MTFRHASTFPAAILSGSRIAVGVVVAGMAEVRTMFHPNLPDKVTLSSFPWSVQLA